jgi:hypothetical protein
MTNTPGPRDQLRRRALRAILTHAFFRWESAVIIALTLLLSFFGPAVPVPVQPWVWLGAGLLAELAIGIATLRNPAINAQVVARMLRVGFNTRQLKTPQNQARVEQALQYRLRIESAIAAQPEGVMRDHLNQIAAEIDEWIANIYSLALRLDTYEHDEIVRQDLRTTPQALQDLQMRLRQADDAGVRGQIEETIEGKQAQLDSLQTLARTMERANYQLEQTLAALGTVYSQLLLVGVKDIDSGRAQRLREDIAEQVAALQDLTSSLDEVYRQPGLESAKQRLGTADGGDLGSAAGEAASTRAGTSTGERRQG